MNITKTEKLKVLDIKEENSKTYVLLESKLFYAGGGGQPPDTGVIETENREENREHANIVNIEKNENRSWFELDKKIELKKGEEVILKLNVERREKLMRMHSGEHIFFKALQKVKENLLLDKIDLDENESSIFVLADKLEWDDVLKAEKLANEVIKKRINVQEIFVKKDEVEKYPELRIKKERIKENEVRIIKINDFDLSACKGTHVKNTSEIGNFLVTKFNCLGNKYEIKFKVNVDEDLFLLAAQSRKIASLVNADVNEIFDRIKVIMTEKEALKEKVRKFSEYVVEKYEKEKLGDIEFYSAIYDDVEKRKMIDKANEIINNGKEKKVLVFINKTKEKNEILICCTQDSGYKANELLKIIFEFGGKGGGNEKIVQGSFSGEPAFVINKIKERLYVE